MLLGFPIHEPCARSVQAQPQIGPEGKAGVAREERTAAAKTQTDLSTKNLLILHAFEGNMPVNIKTDQGLRATLGSGVMGVKNQCFEYLDLARNPGPEHRMQIAELLHLRYGRRKIHLIITLYPEALKMALVRVHAFERLTAVTEGALKDGSHG